MDSEFKKAWLVDIDTNKFKPTGLEWLAWIGQPMIYDGGLSVNRTPEEHQISAKHYTLTM
jgi:hypothetical protein